ncbi:unnamed protein product (macronuclear) [Paramecium tetraurelia]|uniref:LITAF domain-containing protein n=1 Tax=Paramecium tetraurelia TaxID=5888 RepID=A0CFW6_PARTE|nr:uncharacterized protein GSPATT00038125001 [Paramecium tetraurelia]CAK69683.1 unnamed protein product [Paramecium tetraurelia]|eukprot:XP_001437080.1 hypothetical protein (macronuclear) [Paramecium tetraurelia strain d4-2]
MQQSDPNQTQNWGVTTFEISETQQQYPQQQFIPNQQPYPQQYQQYGQQPQQVAYGQPVVTNAYPQTVQVGVPYVQTVIGNHFNAPPQYNANGSPFPIQIICPACKTQGITNVRTEIGAGTYLVSCLLFLCTGILCCWVPCVMPDCQDKIHRCSSCQTEVGIKQYDMC